MGPSGQVKELDSEKSMDTLSRTLGKQEKYRARVVSMW